MQERKGLEKGILQRMFRKLSGMEGAQRAEECDLCGKMDYGEFQWLQGLLAVVAPESQGGTRSENNLWN